MGKKLDFIGQHFNNLYVTAETKKRTPGGCVIWECKCESCGNVVFKSTSALTRQPLDCGCSNKIDITNRRSGKLVAIRPTDKRKSGNIYWECRCDCGNSTLVLATYIQREEVKSCGCLNREPNDRKAVNLTGQRFGRLVALEKTSKRDQRGRIIWKCQCDCGKMVYASTGILRSNNKKSCGCLLEDAPAIINGTAPYKFMDPRPTVKSSTGILGVYRNKQGKYLAKMMFQGKWVLSKSFSNIEDAIKARKEAEEKYYKPLLEELGLKQK